MASINVDWESIWKKEWTSKAREALKERIDSGKFDYYITKDKASKERVVRWLICRGTPFKIKNLGCGYVRIFAEEKTCPKCKGKGVCSPGKK